MSEKKNLVTLVPICSLSIGDLARKGWKPRNKQIISDVNRDEYTSSSDDDLSISFSSSPGTSETKDNLNTKNARHIVTKLNFDDCIVKANQVSIATVERIIKPLNADECSTIPEVGDCSTVRSCQEHEPQFNTFASLHLLSDEMTCVPESPNVGAFNKTKRFEGLQFVHDEKITPCKERETNSEEFLICSPPKCYNLKEHFKIVAPTTEESPMVLVNDSSPLKIRSSSPVMQSSRKKKKISSENQFYELQMQKDNKNNSMLVAVDPVLNQKKENSLHGDDFSNIYSDIDTVGVKLDCEMSSLDLAGLLQSPTSSQTPIRLSKDNISSPILGSKKKRQFCKYTKDKRIRKHTGSVSSDRKPLMPVNKNENVSIQNVCEKGNMVEEELSSVTNSENNCNNKIKEMHSKSRIEISKPSENEEGKQFNVIIDITNQISQGQKQDEIHLKSPGVDMLRNCIQTSATERSLTFQNKDDEGYTLVKLNDSVSPSQTICVSANKLSRRRVKRKLKLTNFTSHKEYTQSHPSWSQTFVTQETVTYYCIRNSDAMNANSGREPSQLLDIFKAKLPSNAEDQMTHDSQDLQLMETQDQALADSFLDQGISCLPDNDCDKSCYVISLDCTTQISKFNEEANGRDKALSTSEETRNTSVSQAIDQNEKYSSEMSISSDIIECSQVIVDSSMRAKRVKANIYKHKINGFVHCNNFDTRPFVSVARNKVYSGNKSNSSRIENDILNTSNYIENVTSDEEDTSPENNKKVARIVSNSRKTMPCLSVKSNLDNTCNILDEVNQLCRTPDKKKDTENYVTPVKNVLNSVPEMENIFQPSKTQIETDTLSQHISCIGTLRSCRMSQEESPRPSFSEKYESQVHISSGSSQDPDQGHCTPPRMAIPPVNMDSGKKRKRLKKDGLAARLQRLLAHKQAATHLCKYEVSVGTRRPGDSVLLVKNAWMEYSRLLVLCSPCPSVEQLQNSNKDIRNDAANQSIQEMSTRDPEENIASLWVLVLDPVVLPLTQLKVNAVIRIYAPWQTLYVPRFAVTLVLDVTYIELVSSSSKGLSPTQTYAVCGVETFHCPCVDGTSKPENCEFQLPDRGNQLWTLLSPALTKSQMSLSQKCNMQIATMDLGTQKGTIAEAIMQHSRALTSGIWLRVKILRIFCYRFEAFALKVCVCVRRCVSDVDEESALSWPVCKQCQRDLIEHKHHHQLLCEHCGLTDPVTKLSLDVILYCSNLPKLHIKVKLLQKSILSLLPGALEGTRFEVENVLGKPIGPLVCVVLEDSPPRISSSSYDMLLQEVQFLGESYELTN
ncbi:Uncharacterized protein GBIM_10211 [Gryllus bimaculatus]|nr:Uncharacterized protein GBIM_10211 [Gryllus bimaculatus]